MSGLTPQVSHFHGARDPILIIFGTVMLWTGWFGFNMGYTYSVSNSKLYDVVHIGTITSLSGSIGGISIFIFDYYKSGLIQPSVIAGGILAGLVTTTSIIDRMEILATFFVVPVGALLYYYGAIILRRFHIDDPVDAIAVHGLPSIWGTMICGVSFLMKDDNPIHSSSHPLIQLLGILCILAWCTLIIGGVIYICKRLRISLLGTKI